GRGQIDAHDTRTTGNVEDTANEVSRSLTARYQQIVNSMAFLFLSRAPHVDPPSSARFFCTIGNVAPRVYKNAARPFAPARYPKRVRVIMGARAVYQSVYTKHPGPSRAGNQNSDMLGSLPSRNARHRNPGCGPVCRE